jgi:hypothetical protein
MAEKLRAAAEASNAAAGSQNMLASLEVVTQPALLPVKFPPFKLEVRQSFSKASWGCAAPAMSQASCSFGLTAVASGVRCHLG